MAARSRTFDEAASAITAMNGALLGSQRIRCGWAQHKQDTASSSFGIIERADPTNTCVYLGNVAADVRLVCTSA